MTFKKGRSEFGMDTAGAKLTFRGLVVARMAELADATDSKSVAL